MSTVLDTRTEGPALELDPFSDDFLTDPFPALDVLRDAGRRCTSPATAYGP